MPLKKLVYAGRLRLRVVECRQGKSLLPFVVDSVALGSTVRTDGWAIYQELPKLGYRHEPLVIGDDMAKADAHLPMIHLVFSNLKRPGLWEPIMAQSRNITCRPTSMSMSSGSTGASTP